MRGFQHLWPVEFVNGQHPTIRLGNILSWFRHRIINSNAEGFKSFQNYRTRIHFFGGELDLKPALICH